VRKIRGGANYASKYGNSLCEINTRPAEYFKDVIKGMHKIVEKVYKSVN